MTPEIEKMVQPDGSLHGDVPYVHWTPADTDATLDGEFSASELRAIADHMDKAARP